MDIADLERKSNSLTKAVESTDKQYKKQAKGNQQKEADIENLQRSIDKEKELRQVRLSFC